MPPAFDEAALVVLAGKPNLRLVVDPELARDEPGPPPDPIGSIRSAGGAVLVTAPDTAPDDPATWIVATRRAPTATERADLDLAWRLVRGVSSNAIVLVKDGRLIGMGSGQTSRVDAARGAVEKARAHAGDAALKRASCASDAFYPFPGRGRGLPRSRRQRLRPAGRFRARCGGDRGRGPGQRRDADHGHTPLPALSRPRGHPGRHRRCYDRRPMTDRPDRPRFYLTTSIAYANNKPGLHTLYEVIGADVIARWHRMNGDDTRFLTGTDEHSINIAQSALDEGPVAAGVRR